MSRCTVSEALNAFAYWLGYCEKATKTYAARREKAYFETDKGAGNFTYPGHLCGIQGGAWCAMMVSCALYEACGGREGAKAAMYGLWPYARCDQLYDAAPADRRGRRDAWDPKPGDVIVFGRSIREHTGMVYAADGTYVYTYEGNSANMCRKRSYLQTSDYIWGYVRPDYAEGERPVLPGEKYGAVCYAEPGLHELSKGCAGPEIRALQALLNARGAALETDGDFGSLTQTAVRAFQKAGGLEEDGIVGRHTWRALLTGAEQNTANT